ncbi:TonB-dependent receptor plug domain-containing protein [Filimonas effusa]|uniref:TonB-dependent receptor plug domain-containing protein n=1 Tax=Filimonas effusa TaxID=2508721 RepID=A0A4Q1D7I2_9BACT|nr:TonB-dependent receptor plug domain-containing protein [Filimonas effusa]RXK83913.1 hypothetical protein ESB13_17750 [Filimonas effusa]
MSTLGRYLLAAGSLLGVMSTLSAQKLDAPLAQLSEQYQQERAYLHFDKQVYSPGETVWFKAYLMAGIYPSDISKNFYVDWTDAEGNVLLHTATPLLEGTAKGQFDIPASFKSQILHVRAYTQWMKNFDSAFLFTKDLRVVQKPIHGTPPKIETTLGFFPESGDLIAGLKSKLAFKANDQWGKPVAVKGRIVDAQGTKIDTFVTQYDGMGFINMEPVAGQKYAAIWKDVNGKIQTTALPESKESGVTMAVSGTGPRRSFLVERAANTPDNLKTLYIVATLQQQMIYRAKVDLTETTAIGGSIPVNTLPSGIIVLSLFDANWLPVAERITFINNHNYSFTPTVDIIGDTRKRAKSFIEIDVPDTVAANMSIAVTDADLAKDTANTIVSYLLLSSEIKGYVHNAAAYFSSKADSLQQHLDLVMLTNGWRRINWEQLAKGQMPAIKYPKDTSFLSFSGKVFGATPSELREAGNINMIFQGKDSSRTFSFLPLKTDGTFSDPNMLFFDTVRVYYQFNSKSKLGSRVAVSFMNGLADAPYKIQGLPAYNFITLDTSGNARARYFADEQARLKKLLETATLEGVTVKSRAKRPVDVLDEKYTSGMFKGDGYQFDVLNDVLAQSSFSVFQYLQGRVAGLQISGTSGGAMGSGQEGATWRGSATSFFLDEMPVDAQQLANIPMTDVAYIKVMRPPFFGSFGGGAGGAIAVYTRRGGDVKSEPGKGLDFKKIAGYTNFKEFYSPNYAVGDPRHDQPDLRTTLYWNPYVLTDPKNHRITVEFYNNDVTKKLRVVLEGVNKDGKLLHFEQEVE